MGQFDQLPRELLYLIFEHCEFEDCKNLRALCKAFVDIATRRVFHTYYIAFFQSHLEQFVELSKNPVIAKSIKNLCFVGDVLPEIESIALFEDLVDMRESWSSFSERFIKERLDSEEAAPLHDHREDSVSPAMEEYERSLQIFNSRQDLRRLAYQEYTTLPRHQLQPDEVKAYFDRYQSFRQQQIRWGPDGMFTRALARLPNLVSVENSKHGFAGNHLRFPWNRIQKEILISPNTWMQLHAVEVDDEVDSIDLLKHPIHMYHADCLLHAITYRAQFNQNTQLQKLKLVNVGGQPFFNYSELLDADDDSKQLSATESMSVSSDDKQKPGFAGVDVGPEYVSVKLKGLAHLTWLEMDVSYCIPPGAETAASQSWQTKQLFREIHAVLSVAPSLQVLKLKCDDDEGDWAMEERPIDPEDDTVRRLDIPTLSKLHTLRLSCTATEGSLIKLLQDHARTLRSLELVDCDLNNGTWKSLIRQIPQMLNLNHAYLEGLHDADYPPDSGEEALFEDGLDLHQHAHGHDRAVVRFLLHGGEMPDLDYSDWYERNREMADQYDEYISTSESSDLDE